MSHISMSFHRCTGLRLASTYPTNANAVTLAIEQGADEIEITIYGLPVEITDKLAALRDDSTLAYQDTG